MSSTIEVRVPDIGDFKDVPVIEVLVKPGDRVKKNDSLITLESEKASMEVPAEADGVVQDVKVKVGDKVSQGMPIVVLATSTDAPATAPAAAPAAPHRRRRRSRYAFRTSAISKTCRSSKCSSNPAIASRRTTRSSRWRARRRRWRCPPRPTASCKTSR